MAGLFPNVTDESPRAKGKSAAAFRTISEVATILDVPQHVLRFWETRFSQIKPLKRGGGRRYYRPEDVTLLQEIRRLLYNEGYTIKGVQRLLREGQPKAVRSESAPPPPKEAPPKDPPVVRSAARPSLPESAQLAIRSVIVELEAVRDALNAEQK